MSGPPPKPTAMKLIAGNPGKRALNHDEPQPERRTPPCPAFLTKKQRKYWKKLAPRLSRLRVLTEADGEALTLACIALAEVEEAQEQIEKYGRVVKTPSGYAQPSPYVSMRNKAIDQARNLLADFGLSPSSRSRIIMSKGTDGDGNRGRDSLKGRLFGKKIA